MSQLVAVRLPEEMVKRIDERGGRTEVIKQALEEFLSMEREPEGESVKRARRDPVEPLPATVSRSAVESGRRCDCGKALVEWGPQQLRCVPCGRNYPRS